MDNNVQRIKKGCILNGNTFLGESLIRDTIKDAGYKMRLGGDVPAFLRNLFARILITAVEEGCDSVDTKNGTTLRVQNVIEGLAKRMCC